MPGNTKLSGPRFRVDNAGNRLHRVRNGEKTRKDKDDRVIFVLSDDPIKVDTGRWLFRTYAEKDIGMRAMAEELNGLGIPGPRGGLWSVGSIREILKNTKYVGDSVWNKRREGKYHRVGVGEVIKERDRTEVTLAPNTGKPHAVDNPEEMWIAAEGVIEALIDRKTFDRVQEKLHQRRMNQKGPRFPYHRKHNGDQYLLTGLVYCQHCGERMHGQTSTRKKNGKTYRYPKYICQTYKNCGRNNPSSCGYHTIKQADIVGIIVDKLRDVVLAGSRDRFEDIIRKKLAKRSKPDTKRVNALRRRVGELDKQIDRAADRLLSAPDDLMDILAPKLSAMRREQERIQRELEQAEVATAPVDVDGEAKAVAAKLWTLADELDKAEPARVRELFQRFVSKVELRFDHIQRGKRMECPFASGEITLNPAMFPIVSRGDWI